MQDSALISGRGFSAWSSFKLRILTTILTNYNIGGEERKFNRKEEKRAIGSFTHLLNIGSSRKFHTVHSESEVSLRSNRFNIQKMIAALLC